MAGDEDKGRMTTLSLWERTKARLDAIKVADAQSYDEVLNALVDNFVSKGKQGEDRLRHP